MRYIAILVGLGLLGYLGYNRYMEATKPEAKQQAVVELPPPPPEMTAPPPPVLDKESLERVRSATKDSDPLVRWEAVQFLVQANDPQSEEMLYYMLHRDSDATIRRNIVGIVSDRRGSIVTKNLVESLRDTDVEVRLAALIALAKVGDVNASSDISEAIRDTDERVRLEALRTLKLLEGARAQQIQEQQRQHDVKMRTWEDEMKRRQEAELKKKQPQQKK
ncbi:MAG: HEAT repeat domain-containing protein [Elusimicrobiota bacterium]